MNSKSEEEKYGEKLRRIKRRRDYFLISFVSTGPISLISDILFRNEALSMTLAALLVFVTGIFGFIAVLTLCPQCGQEFFRGAATYIFRKKYSNCGLPLSTSDRIAGGPPRVARKKFL